MKTNSSTDKSLINSIKANTDAQKFVRTIETIDHGNKSKPKKKNSKSKKDSPNASLMLNSGFNFTSSLISSSVIHKKSYPEAQK